MRLIDADAILYWADDSGIKDMGYVRKGQIDSMPTIEAKPIKHGRWIDGKCSVCNYGVESWNVGTNFCPNCGADMRERREDD